MKLKKQRRCILTKYDCIFLDRDGTLNPDPGYISSLKDFAFYDFTIPALKMMSKKNNQFCIVTNQSGVGRGLISISKIKVINNFIKRKFKNNCITLNEIYMCFDHPDDASINRKPGSGMFLKAKSDHNLRLSKCLMVGDSLIDMEAGYNLGMETLLVLTGNGEKTLDRLKGSNLITYQAKNIYEGFKQLCH